VILIDGGVWADILRHCTENYPSEACGILVGPKGESAGTVFHVCLNVYDEMHAREPETYPRTSKTAYLISGREQKCNLRRQIINSEKPHHH